MTKYDVLGTRRDADPAEIEAAYEALVDHLALEHTNASASRRARIEAERAELDAAYRVLSDPERRRNYDASLGCADCGHPVVDDQPCPGCHPSAVPPTAAGDDLPHEPPHEPPHELLHDPARGLPHDPPHGPPHPERGVTHGGETEPLPPFTREGPDAAEIIDRAPAPAPTADSLGWLVAVVAMVAVTVAAVAGIGWMLLDDTGVDVGATAADDGDASSESTVVNPQATRAVAEAWDPRVVDLVEFVERERGLRFEHPVPVEFLAEDEFRSRVAVHPEDLDPAERRHAELAGAELRALGLAVEDVDLFALGAAAGVGEIVGLYDPETGVVAVRGERLDLATQATLVHELTHALQDQHFDLSPARTDAFATDGERLAFRALFEGDATRIEQAYVDQLGKGDLDAYAGEAEARIRAFEAADAPDVLGALVAAPYGLGEAFLAFVEALEGRAGLGIAFEEPPTTEEHLVDPWSWLDREPAFSVEPVAVPPGAEVLDDADFGVLAWLFVLAERIDTSEALEAVEGWGGDRYASYVDGGRVCVAAAFVGDTETDTAQMHQALTAWAAAMPPGAAVVRRDDRATEMRSCDPGEAAAAPVLGRSTSLLGMVVARSWVAAGLLETPGISRSTIRCYTDEWVRAFEALGGTLAGDDPAAEQRAAELGASAATAAAERCLGLR